ncbi:hypothetical protein FN846DRAFT_946567 [Sphaerosporella brunnea]|uniref:Uncharacterized protein n=1 Tax=Sphaerosporella brunnea TaxID=1250544 RepID=A0A5J5EYB5_9PEZI|nr:hypothetical protein FN846DRAFT_946567 [Sphaerosporella brunnea]
MCQIAYLTRGYLLLDSALFGNALSSQVICIAGVCVRKTDSCVTYLIFIGGWLLTGSPSCLSSRWSWRGRWIQAASTSPSFSAL